MLAGVHDSSMKHHESCVDKPGGYQYVLMDRFAAELMTGNNPGSQAAAVHCRGFCLYHVCFYIFWRRSSHIEHRSVMLWKEHGLQSSYSGM